MTRYIIKRLLSIIPIVLGISIIIFTLLSISPGNPATLMIGREATDEQVAVLEAQLGLDQPLLTQYVNYMTDLLRGDFGTSWQTRGPVIDEIAVRFPVTLKLSVFSTLIVIFFGVTVGIISAVKQYTKLDYVVTTSSLVIASMPDFWIGLMLMLLFALKLRWVPPVRSKRLDRLYSSGNCALSWNYGYGYSCYKRNDARGNQAGLYQNCKSKGRR